MIAYGQGEPCFADVPGQSQAVILTGSGSPQKNMVPPVLVLSREEHVRHVRVFTRDAWGDCAGRLALTRLRSDVYMKLEAWSA